MDAQLLLYLWLAAIVVELLLLVSSAAPIQHVMVQPDDIQSEENVTRTKVWATIVIQASVLIGLSAHHMSLHHLSFS